MLEAKNVTFSYVKGKKVLDKFSFEFLNRNAYVICGENGCGKTTLLKLLLGLLEPDSGVIEKESDCIIGYVPDYNGVYENLTLLDNVIFRLGIYNMKYEQVEDRLEKWLAAYGMTQYKNAYIRDLSLGTKKKAGLLCALLIKPQLLVLDEPTDGLDKGSKEELIHILQQLKKDMTIITVTHDDYYINKFESELIKLE